MPRRLIVFATKDEAEATLRTLNATRLDNAAFTCKEGVVLLCGMGMQVNLTPYVAEVSEVWNLGLAGSLRDAPAIGTLLQIKTVGSGKKDLIHFDDGKSTLITSSIPVHNKTLRQELAKKWDLVDMEGYAIAHTARYFGKKCRMWKIVSDFASPGGKKLIQENMTELSEILAEKIYNTI